MNRIKLTIVAALLPLLAFSQTTVVEGTSAQPVEPQKDSTEFVSVADIVKAQEDIYMHRNTEKHFSKVWSRRSFFNIGYNSSKLIPKQDITTGLGTGNVQRTKSDFGFSLQYGRSYRLHKKPILNMLQFYIDYTSIDVTFNHYKAGDAPVYDSKQERSVTDSRGKPSTYYYIPWDLERFEGSYGMSLGPSFTVLPFRYVNNDQLHFLKFNMYFRVGYQASILYMSNNYELDKNHIPDSKVDESLIMHWGHGLLTSFGLSLTWKGIGIGYEHRVAYNRYKSFTTSIFGNDIYKFKTSTDRIFISIRMGR
jgi:hypothetical protein